MTQLHALWLADVVLGVACIALMATLAQAYRVIRTWRTAAQSWEGASKRWQRRYEALWAEFTKGPDFYADPDDEDAAL
jgi:hypothetical protein